MARARKKCRRTRFKFAEIRRDLAVALDLGGNKAIQDVEWHSGVMSPPQLPHVSLFLLERVHLFQTTTTKTCCRFQSLENYHSEINDADKVRPLR